MKTWSEKFLKLGAVIFPDYLLTEYLFVTEYLQKAKEIFIDINL